MSQTRPFQEELDVLAGVMRVWDPEASLAVQVCGMKENWKKIREDGNKIGVKPEELDTKYELQRYLKQDADIVGRAGADEWCDLRDHYLGPCGEKHPGWLSGNGKECAFVGGLAEKQRKLDAAAAAAAKDATKRK